MYSENYISYIFYAAKLDFCTDALSFHLQLPQSHVNRRGERIAASLPAVSIDNSKGHFHVEWSMLLSD